MIAAGIVWVLALVAVFVAVARPARITGLNHFRLWLLCAGIVVGKYIVAPLLAWLQGGPIV